MILKDAISHLEEELKNKEDWTCVACKEDHEQLLEWLKELQAIKETKPSEVLGCLERLGAVEISHTETEQDEDFNGDWVFDTVTVDDGAIEELYYEDFNIIKNYIQKAQEQEKVLSTITKKNIDIFELKISKKVEEYNAVVKRPFDTLTKEEFKLLKEYFKYER